MPVPALLSAYERAAKEPPKQEQGTKMIIKRRYAAQEAGEWLDIEVFQLECDWCGRESKQTDTWEDLQDWELVVAGRGARRNMCPECVPAEKS